ncbi:MAG TPA: SDR family NAD(P)-dependent oxidoreductase [Caldilineaceae bacterium]|nr:SDR family NAD(P)-dependent oxidoreductase [Caldilineaceae bacterium]
MQRFVGEVAIVTGAGNGIGAASAKRLAAEGATVIIADRDDRAAQQTADAIAESGGQAEVGTVDVTDRASVQKLVDQVIARHNRIDVLCNIAGIAIGETFLEVTDEAWQRTLGVNLTGVYLCSQIVARAMVEQDIAGRIVNMASTNGLVGEANLAHYNASKFGVVGLTMTMAIDLAPHNIRVNSVCPGLIKTRLTASSRNNPEWANDYLKKIPLKRFGEPEEVAAAVAFLASTDSGFITGHQLVIDGGQLTF